MRDKQQKQVAIKSGGMMPTKKCLSLHKKKYNVYLCVNEKADVISG